MSDTVFVFVDTTQGANPPGGRRPGSPRRRGEPPCPVVPRRGFGSG